MSPRGAGRRAHGAQALTAGSPQLLYMSLWLWAAYALLRRPAWRWTALGGGLATLMALPQLLAEGELFTQAFRGGNQPLGVRGQRLVAAGALVVGVGAVRVRQPGGAAGIRITAFMRPTFSVGIAALLLAAIGLGGGHPHPQRTFWTVVLALSMALAMGVHTPLYAPALQWVPGLAWFRVPARWWLLAACSLAVLAACGVDRLLQATPTDRARPAWMVIIAGEVALVGIWQMGIRGAAVSEVVAAAAVALAAALAAGGMSWGYKRLGAAVLLGLVCLELGTLAVRYMPVRVPLDWIDHETTGLSAAMPWGRGLTTPSPGGSGAPTHWASVFHLRSIQGYHAMVLDETMDYLFTAVFARPTDDPHRHGTAGA